jgi:hypothetical protein
MFDPEAIKIAVESIQAELPVRKWHFDLEVSRVHSNAVQSGGIGGSSYLFLLANACASEAEAAADRNWRILHRVLVTTGVEYSDDLATLLKSEFEDIFRRYCWARPQQVITDEVNKRPMASTGGGGPGVNPALMVFEERVIGTRQRFDAEIELFARSLKRRPNFERGVGRPAFQFYAPVGAIQTGDASSATVTLNFDGAARQEVVEALDKFSGELSRAAGLLTEDRDEIRDAITEARQ